MRCKKHFTDLSSIVGVCASCLRERLFTLIEAQAQAQLQAHAREDHRKFDANPPELIFPRSVSPYISRRKSDNAAAWPQLKHSLSDQRFYSTPQIGPNGVIIASSLYKKKQGKFSLLSALFRSKTQKFDLDPSLDSKSRESFSTTTTTASPSWFSNFFPGKRKEKSHNFTISDPTVDRGNQKSHRGMSPTVESDDECCDRSSGYTSDSSQGWKETPQRTAAPVHRSGRRQNQPRNLSSLAFCLSPLVRASPNSHWNQKGMPLEATLPGEIRAPAKPRLGVAAAFRANRSRKLGQFGKFHPNY